MGDLTKNFSRSEFACSCGCDLIAVDFSLVTALQNGVDYFTAKYNQKVSCIITSGNRCPDCNKAAGGAENSTHLLCLAVDHKFFLKQTGHQIEPEEVAQYYEKTFPESSGIGRYSNRTHFDTRIKKARW